MRLSMCVLRAPVVDDDPGRLRPHTFLLVCALAAGVVAQGGYYLPGRVLVTALVFAAAGAALWYRPPRRCDADALLGAAALLAVWVAARAAMIGRYQAAIAPVLTLGCLVAAVLVMRRTDAPQRRRCAGAVVALGVLVAVTGWAGVAWRSPRWAVPVEGSLWRAASTLTYPNAAAALLAPAALVALALLIERPRSMLRAAATYLLLVGLGATLSRGGLVALLAGLVVLAVFAGVRAAARAAAPAVLGAAVAVAALAPSVPVGASARPGLALLGLVAGAVLATGPVLLPARARVAVIATGFALAPLALAAQLTAGRRAAGLDRLLASRATLESWGRSEAGRAALRLVVGSPLLGVGPGQARFFWSAPDGRGRVALYAHDEYLQWLVELGAIGLVLLVVLLAALARHAWRGRPVAGGSVLWAGAVAGVSALAVHSGLDFLWHLAVVPVFAGLLLGLAGPDGDLGEDGRGGEGALRSDRASDIGGKVQ